MTDFRPLVDARLGIPASDQLRSQILAAVRDGSLAAGDPLPPVRRLAMELGIAPNTVAKVYRELERDEVVITAGRNGTSIAPVGEGPGRQAQAAALVFAQRITELGVAPDEALAFVASALRVRAEPTSVAGVTDAVAARDAVADVTRAAEE